MRRRSKLISLILIGFLFIMPYFALFQSNIALLTNSSEFNLGIMADPVEIDGNYWLSQNASSGYGNSTHPYIIEDLVIDLNAINQHGIFINNTDAHFIIQNCTISNAESSYAGIYLKNVTNGTVQNNTLDDNFEGIYLKSSNRSNILDNVLVNNHYRGIKMENSENIEIYNNSLDSCNQYGIYMTYVNYINLINNTVNATTGTDTAVYLYKSNDTTFFNNTISNNHHGIVITASTAISYNNSLINNTFIGNNEGIELTNQVNCELINNTVYTFHQNGFEIAGGFNHTILYNNLSECTEGIRFTGSNNNTISNNTFNGNTFEGIYMLSSSNNNTIFNNSFSKGGLQVSTSSFQEILNNTFSEGSNIQLSSSHNDTIYYNIVRNATGSWNLFSIKFQ